jgi:hypothetical protein
MGPQSDGFQLPDFRSIGVADSVRSDLAYAALPCRRFGTLIRNGGIRSSRLLEGTSRTANLDTESLDTESHTAIFNHLGRSIAARIANHRASEAQGRPSDASPEAGGETGLRHNQHSSVHILPFSSSISILRVTSGVPEA